MYDAIKVFSATKFRERDRLGDVISYWIKENPNYKIVDTTVTQSSDDEFHCLAITIYYNIN